MREYVHHLEYGSGELLVLLPGNWSTSKCYKSIAQKLSKKYKVIVPDLYRGYSRYTKNAMTSNDYVSTLHSFLDSINVKKFFLIGFSFSGMIAVDYSKRYPTNIKKMMLVSSIKFPLNLKKQDITLFAGLIDYTKLFYHNAFSARGNKVNLFWLSEGISFIIRHTKQFFIDALIAIKYSKDISFKPLFPIKILLARNDEFVVCKETEKRNNIEIEVIDGYHAWFFLNEKLLVEKVFSYFQ